jgi:hypothetical protein
MLVVSRFPFVCNCHEDRGKKATFGSPLFRTYPSVSHQIFCAQVLRAQTSVGGQSLPSVYQLCVLGTPLFPICAGMFMSLRRHPSGIKSVLTQPVILTDYDLLWH